jgi:ABC-type sugar transport system substrate-binding protein
MKKLRVVVSLPNDNAYQHAQGLAAKTTAQSLGIQVDLLHAQDDSITQSQQLLEIIQGSGAARPDAFVVEPVTAAGLPRVAEAAVQVGIAWVISNSEVDYVNRLRANPQVPVFTVTQGQSEIGRLQGRQLSALLPRGGSVLMIEGPGMSSVASQRRAGVDGVKPRGTQITSIRSKWSEDSACQSVSAWLRLATSRAEKFDLIAGQTHELALGARKALQMVEDAEQKNRWMVLPFIGIGIATQVKPLVDRGVLAAAVITSVTMELALRMVVRAIETRIQPPERSVVEALSLPELQKLVPKPTLA